MPDRRRSPIPATVVPRRPSPLGRGEPAPPPAPARRPLRPGLGLFVGLWLTGTAAGQLAAAAASAWADPAPGDDLSAPWVFGVVLPGQNLAILGVAWWVTRRRGGNRTDLGLRLERRHAPWLVVGMVAQVVLAALSWPLQRLIDADGPAQDLVESLQEQRSVGLVVLAIGSSVLLAPVVEEVLYRWILLHALQRHLGSRSAVVVSAAIFASVHLFGISSWVDALTVIPGLFALALLLGSLVVVDGHVGRAILVHAGFNLVATTVAFAS